MDTDDKGRSRLLTSPGTGIDYPTLVRESLLSMVRGLIELVAEEGFPGDHHFLITFGTRDPGVVIPARLLKRFPDEMTIVLQHQFWNLAADAHALHVTLRFGGMPERLGVPWAALRVFSDPSVNFGLQLQAPAERARESVAEAPGDARPRRATNAPNPEVSGPATGASHGNVVAFSARTGKGTKSKG